MKVIILAGGKATRLPKSAKNIPKPLVKIAGKPILQHQVDLLEKHGLTDIRLSLGYRAEQIIEHLERDFGYCPRVGYKVRAGTVSTEGGRARTESLSPARWAGRGKREDNTRNLSIEYIIESEPLGTGGAIKLASRDLKEDFMVLNGDILSDINLSEFITKYLASRIQEQYNISRETLGAISLFFQNDASDYGLVQIENERVTDFLEKPSQKCSGHINAGFYILSPRVFENVSRETFSIEKDIFPEMVKKGQLTAYIHKGYWTDLGTEKRLEKAKNKFLMFHVKQ